jgi:hypothetical protein
VTAEQRLQRHADARTENTAYGQTAHGDDHSHPHMVDIDLEDVEKSESATGGITQHGDVAVNEVGAS